MKLNDMFEQLHERIDLSTNCEIVNACKKIIYFQSLDYTQKEIISSLFKNGPLHDGNMISNNYTNQFINDGIVSKICFNGSDGYTALTQKGYWIYKLIELERN